MSDQTQAPVTDSQFLFANSLGSHITIPGTVVCCLVLLAYGAIALGSKAARRHLDRVSFRLLTYSLFFNVLFGIDYALTPATPGRGCTLGAFFNNLTLCLSTFFTTCIAINLQCIQYLPISPLEAHRLHRLVLVHRRNGQALEKYYVLGTVLLTLILNIPTVALNQFGWNDDTATCWYSNSSSSTRLNWIIGTSSFWVALAATVETTCSSVVLLWLHFHVKSIRTLSATDYTGQTTIDTAVASDSASGQTTAPNSPRPDSKEQRRESDASGQRSLALLDPQFRNIILRIALYPIISLIMNYTTVILDLYISIFGIVNQKDFHLLVSDLIFYGLRAFAYGVLAASDPSFIKGAKTILKEQFPAKNASRPVLADENDRKSGLTSLNFAANPRIENIDASPKIDSAVVAWSTLCPDIERQERDREPGQRRYMEQL